MASTLIEDIVINFSPISSFISFIDFNNLSIHTDKDKETVESLFNLEYQYVNEFGKIKKNMVVNNEYTYKVDHINYYPIFHSCYPKIPVIKILEPDNVNINQQLYFNGIPLGIFIDRTTIIPYVILIPILRSLVIHNGVFMMYGVEYNIVEMMDVQLKHFLQLKNDMRINKYKLAKQSLIYSINKQQFNKNGSLYHPVSKLFLPLNLVLMMNRTNEIEISFSPGNKINFVEGEEFIPNIKTITLNLELFTQEKLQVPLHTSDKLTLANIEIYTLTQELMQQYKDYIVKDNFISDKKIMCTVKHDKIYLLNKIGQKLGKNIKNVNECKDYLNKSKAKTLKFFRNDEFLEIMI